MHVLCNYSSRLPCLADILPLFHLHGHCHYPCISLTISPYLLYFSIIYKPTVKLFLFDILLSDCHHQADSNGSLYLGHCMIAQLLHGKSVYPEATYSSHKTTNFNTNQFAATPISP